MAVPSHLPTHNLEMEIAGTSLKWKPYFLSILKNSLYFLHCHRTNAISYMTVCITNFMNFNKCYLFMSNPSLTPWNMTGCGGSFCYLIHRPSEITERRVNSCHNSISVIPKSSPYGLKLSQSSTPQVHVIWKLIKWLPSAYTVNPGWMWCHLVATIYFNPHINGQHVAALEIY